MGEEIKVNPTLFTRKSQTNESGFHMRMTYVYGVKSLFLNKRQKKNQRILMEKLRLQIKVLISNLVETRE